MDTTFVSMSICTKMRHRSPLPEVQIPADIKRMSSDLRDLDTKFVPVSVSAKMSWGYPHLQMQIPVDIGGLTGLYLYKRDSHQCERESLHTEVAGVGPQMQNCTS